MSDYVEAQAAAMALIVVYGLLVSLVREVTRLRSKNLPRVGISLKDFVRHWNDGDLACRLHERFRHDREKKETMTDEECGGVMEASQPGRFWLGRRRFYVVVNHETARFVLESSTTTKWQPAYQFFADTANGMNLASESGNGPRWKHVQASMAKAFSASNIYIKMVNVLDDQVDEWIRAKLEPCLNLAENEEGGEEQEPAIDILAEMKALTASVICKAAFDYILTESECAALIQNIDVCNREFATMVWNVPHWMMKWRLFQSTNERKEAGKKLFAFCTKVLMAYRAKKIQQPHLLIDLMDKDDDYVDDRERICNMVALIVAGLDTTANTLAFCLGELAAHPDEQDFLRDALKYWENESNEDKRHCPTLKHVIRETMRLHPVNANGAIRVTDKSSPTPITGTSYMIPPGSIVCIPFYPLLRNEKIYESPDSFRPERWEEPTDRMIQCFMPFAAGMRGCPGQALAQAQMEAVLAKLIPRYAFYVIDRDTSRGASYLHMPVGLKLGAYKLHTEKENDEETRDLEIPPRSKQERIICFNLFSSRNNNFLPWQKQLES